MTLIILYLTYYRVIIETKLVNISSKGLSTLDKRSYEQIKLCMARREAWVGFIRFTRV